MQRPGLLLEADLLEAKPCTQHRPFHRGRESDPSKKPEKIFTLTLVAVTIVKIRGGEGWH